MTCFFYFLINSFFPWVKKINLHLMTLSSSQIEHICACGLNPKCRNPRVAAECATVLAKAYNVTTISIYDLWEMNAKSNSRKRDREDFASGSDESVDDMLYEWDQKPWSKLAFIEFVDPFA